MLSAAIEVFENLKKDIANSAIVAMDSVVTLVVDIDAFDCAILLLFFKSSRSEQWHAAVEKEVYAIIEALWKWRHYLIGWHFRLIIDQKSVALMFNTWTANKIKVKKNSKMENWTFLFFLVTCRPSK